MNAKRIVLLVLLISVFATGLVFGQSNQLRYGIYWSSTNPALELGVQAEYGRIGVYNVWVYAGKIPGGTHLWQFQGTTSGNRINMVIIEVNRRALADIGMSHIDVGMRETWTIGNNVLIDPDGHRYIWNRE